jgi:uncharacterized membrane protein YfcA
LSFLFPDLAIVTLASLFAGFVDAIVGGGGLILVPALFGTFPNAAPATLLGTNKATGIWGTGWATWQFAKRVKIEWAAMLPAATAALIGSLFVFAFVRLLGYDFLNASASAKLLNTATNLAALVLFALKGHVWWHAALPMAAANVVGSLLGTKLALKHGAGFVRIVFIVVVAVLILKTGWDAFVG